MESKHLDIIVLLSLRSRRTRRGRVRPLIVAERLLQLPLLTKRRSN